MSSRKPPLAGVHTAADAKLTEFGGWEIPVEFDSIRSEHEAVRTTAGKFDVSHMGQVIIDGPDAAELMNRLTTNDVESLSPGDAQYAAITDENGIMLDDTVIYYRPTYEDFLFIPNAGHDREMTDRCCTYRDEWGLDATVDNQTETFGMIAVQGPESISVVDSELPDVGSIDRFTMEKRRLADDSECFISRTGYTGEDGFELLFDAASAEFVWNALSCQPCGLGARDTLRLEASFLLSGQDFDPETNPRNPYEAGIGFAVELETEFIGRDALAEIESNGPDETLVGLKLLDRGIPRQGYEIRADGQQIGQVTSGTMSPTLGEPIALGYVPVSFADPGTDVDIIIRESSKRATLVELPFYRAE